MQPADTGQQPADTGRQPGRPTHAPSCRLPPQASFPTKSLIRLKKQFRDNVRTPAPPHPRTAAPLQVGLSAGPGCVVEKVKVTELFAFDAMGRTPVESASAGDIVTFAGIESFNIGDTVVDLAEPRPLPPITVEQPTMSMTFGVNKSAVAGKVSGAELATPRHAAPRRANAAPATVAARLWV